MPITVATDQVEVDFPILVRWRPNQPAYLVIKRIPDGVLFEPTRRGRGTLNRFWKVWLRDLLMQAKPDHQLAVRINKRNVEVKSPRPLKEWIDEVRKLAANVTPIHNAPIRRVRGNEPGLSVKWVVDPGFDLTEAVREVKLPACDAGFWELEGGLVSVRLYRSGTSGRGMRKRTFSTGEIVQLIELQLAVACRRRELTHTNHR